MLALFVDVHRAAKHEHGAERVRRRHRCLRGYPLDDLVASRGCHEVEHATSCRAFVDDRQHAHGVSVTDQLRPAELIPHGACSVYGWTRCTSLRSIWAPRIM